MRIWMFALLAATAAFAQQDEYHGPEPPKADVPYLLHASTLVETQTGEAKEESKKGGTLFWVDGAASTARTPLAEPIFILKTSKLNPDKLELYKFDVVKGRRELTIKDKPGKNDRPIYISVTKVGKDLYRIEASEQLANGEYALTPERSNQVFTFQVY